MRRVENYDLSVKGYERRGCLHIDVEMEGRCCTSSTCTWHRLHGAAAPGARLTGAEIPLNRRLNGPRLMPGDFNEWAPGLTTKPLRSHLRSVDILVAPETPAHVPGRCPCCT
jgi:endonuclease/exonuclease/phosphatase family metal-dependent hydrolase